MSTLPHSLYTTAQTRELDRLATAEFGVSSNILMERAGEAAFNLLHSRWPQAKRIAVFCGTGNNGGDGFVVARLAREQDIDVSVFQVGDVAKLQGDALAAMQRLTGADVNPVAFERSALTEYDVIVDALLGTGISGEVSGEYKQAISSINASGIPVLALDVPSGLDADTGKVAGIAVKADSTMTFIGVKQGLLTADGPTYVGALVFSDLNVPEKLYEQQIPACQRLDYNRLKSLLAPRPGNAHKGDFGHVLIIGGDSGMAGAVRLAGEAALRVGAGLVSIATRKEHAPLISSGRPELMSHGVEDAHELQALSERASHIAIGPGLGQSDWAQEMLGFAVASGKPLVMDADALNLVARNHLPQTMVRANNRILTPHPGEAARLLEQTSARIQTDRFAASRALFDKFGGVVVLKGAGTLVAGSEGTGLCDAGNPGMASAGMGDVLTGIISGLLAQDLDLAQAAQLGVCLHAEAGDAAAKAVGERGLLASDLMPWIRRLANPNTAP